MLNKVDWSMTMRLYDRNSHHLNKDLQKAGRMLKITDYSSKMGQTSHAVGQKING